MPFSSNSLISKGFVIPRRRLGEVLLREHAGDRLPLQGYRAAAALLAEQRQLALDFILEPPVRSSCFCAKSSLSIPPV